MEKGDRIRIINAIKQKQYDQLDSASKLSLVFIDNKTFSLYSLDVSDYEMILNGLLDVDNFYIKQEPYLFNGFKFYSIEFDPPF
jgi:hypothetical protein